MAGGDGLRLAARPRREIAARLARLGNARQAIGDDLAVDQEHALVALRDLGDEALRHHAARAAGRDRFDDHVAVRIVVAHAEDARASHAVQALEHHLLLFFYEPLQVCHVPRNQGGHRELGKFRDHKLFVVIA
jgi:hypothetical protein